jgi:hypothetical protein
VLEGVLRKTRGSRLQSSKFRTTASVIARLVTTPLVSLARTFEQSGMAVLRKRVRDILKSAGVADAER